MGSDCRPRTDQVTFIEGRSEISKILTELSGVITKGTAWTDLHHHYRAMYATYTRTLRRNQSRWYVTEDGERLAVYELPKAPDNRQVGEDGIVYEVKDNAPDRADLTEYRTGYSVDTKGVTVSGRFYKREDVLLVLKDMYPKREEETFENPWEKYRSILLEYSREDFEGNLVEDKLWDSFREVGKTTERLEKYLYNRSITYDKYTVRPPESPSYVSSRTYSRSQASGDLWEFEATKQGRDGAVAMMCNPKPDQEYLVVIRQPFNSNNYIYIEYGGEILLQRTQVGDMETTHKGIVNINEKGVEAGGKLTILDRDEAYRAYERQLAEIAVPGQLLVEGNSPSSYWYFSRQSPYGWMGERPEYSSVEYTGHVNNDRFVIRLKADPSYDYDSYFNSLAYVGKAKPLNPEFDDRCFVVTTGMASGVRGESEILLKDIRPETSEEYAQFGRWTSNGMESVSMLRSLGNLYYQAYYPAFLTEMPNFKGYPAKPPVPSPWDEDSIGLLKSQRTGKIHASPVYLVHPYEGHTAIMEGIVAINGKNLIDGEKIVEKRSYGVDKYQAMIIDTPICFLEKSAAPNNSRALAVLVNVEGD